MAPGLRSSLKYRSFAGFWITAANSHRPSVASSKPAKFANSALVIPWPSRICRTSAGVRTPRYRQTASCRSRCPTWSRNSRSHVEQYLTGRSTFSWTTEPRTPYSKTSVCWIVSTDALSHSGHTGKSSCFLALSLADRSFSMATSTSFVALNRENLLQGRSWPLADDSRRVGAYLIRTDLYHMATCPRKSPNRDFLHRLDSLQARSDKVPRCVVSEGAVGPRAGIPDIPKLGRCPRPAQEELTAHHFRYTTFYGGMSRDDRLFGLAFPLATDFWSSYALAVSQSGAASGTQVTSIAIDMCNSARYSS